MASISSPPPTTTANNNNNDDNDNEKNINNTTSSIENEPRNAEIWSTRLQRELLAMVTDNAPEGAKKEMTTTLLPSFCVVKDHAMDIERGNCTLSCLLKLPKSEQQQQESDDAKSKNTECEAKTETEEAASSSTSGVSSDVPIIAITLDVSLTKKSDGSVDATAISYPFLKPVAILSSGSHYFPEGSTIQDGDNIDIEMDWTPSLHLTDAILNVALKLKECLSQGEAVHPSTAVEMPTVVAPKADVVGDVVNRAKKLGSSFGLSLRNLTESSNKSNSSEGEKSKRSSRLGLARKNKAKKQPRPKANHSEVRIGDEINMLEAPWVNCQVYSCKAVRRPQFVDEAIALAVPNEEKTEDKESTQVRNNVISNSLLDQDSDQGRVPDEFREYMRLQAKSVNQVANAGFAGAGAMFRSFTNSARGVLEESFLMITENHIIELRSNKLNLSTGTVTFAIPIEMMAKLKFRRKESVSLFFKPAPDDPLIYMCPDSADCVHQIQAVLKRHGVKGKHTNAGTHRAINQALHLVQEIQTKELALNHDPSIDRVNEIMDLYRQAAERFEVAGDVRHEEVVTHMRKFLALPLTVSVLDGSYKKPVDDDLISTITGEGVVLDKTVGDNKSDSVKEDEKFEENMDNLLAEAEADLANMKTSGDDPELDAMLDDDDIGGDGSADDVIADFENMLKEADDELAELMSS